jgi:hypothetical protein
VVEVAASSSKYVRSGRKFKSAVYFGWFCDGFVLVSDPIGTDFGDENQTCIWAGGGELLLKAMYVMRVYY